MGKWEKFTAWHFLLLIFCSAVTLLIMLLVEDSHYKQEKMTSHLEIREEYADIEDELSESLESLQLEGLERLVWLDEYYETVWIKEEVEPLVCHIPPRNTREMAWFISIFIIIDVLIFSFVSYSFAYEKNKQEKPEEENKNSK